MNRTPNEDGYLFTEEEIENIKKLGEVLLRIRLRMIKDGIDIEEEKKKLGLDK